MGKDKKSGLSEKAIYQMLVDIAKKTKNANCSDSFLIPILEKAMG